MSSERFAEVTGLGLTGIRFLMKANGNCRYQRTYQQSNCKLKNSSRYIDLFHVYNDSSRIWMMAYFPIPKLQLRVQDGEVEEETEKEKKIAGESR